MNAAERILSNFGIQFSSACRMAARDHKAPSNACVQQVSGAPVQARLAELGEEANRRNYSLLVPFELSVSGLVEQINQIDAAMVSLVREASRAEENWSRHGDRATHVPFVRGAWLATTLLAIVGGEAVLASKVLAGLQMHWLEKWLVAASVVGTSTLAIKAIAWGARGLSDDWHDRLPVYWAHLIASFTGLLMFGLMLFGQYYAREAYAEAAAAVGESTLSHEGAVALTLLQAGLYLLLGVALFFWTGHLRQERARANLAAARRRVDALHEQRRKLAGKLNTRIHQLYADWQYRIATFRSVAAEYVQEMVNRGRLVSDAAVNLDHMGCRPMPDWVWTVADPHTAQRQATLENGAFNAATTDSLNARSDALLLKAAYMDAQQPPESSGGAHVQAFEVNAKEPSTAPGDSGTTAATVFPFEREAPNEAVADVRSQA